MAKRKHTSGYVHAPTAEDQIDDAVRAITRAYIDHVEEMAREIVDTTKEDDISDAIAERVNDSEYIIYTRQNLFVILATRYGEEVFEQEGTFEATDESSTYQRIAYYAMVRDVSEAVERILEAENE